MAQLLAYRHVLAGVIPVMVNRSLQKVSVNESDLFAVSHRPCGKTVGSEPIKPGICRLGDRLPCLDRSFERGSAGRGAIGEFLGDVGKWSNSLPEIEEVPLFLPGEMSDVPTQGVHRQNPLHCVFGGDPPNSPHELPSGEAQLIDERMDRHDSHRYHRPRCTTSANGRRLGVLIGRREPAAGRPTEIRLEQKRSSGNPRISRARF